MANALLTSQCLQPENSSTSNPLLTQPQPLTPTSLLQVCFLLTAFPYLWLLSSLHSLPCALISQCIIALFHGSLPGFTPGGSQVYLLQVITSLTTTPLCLLSFVFQMCVSVLPCIFSFVFHSRHAVTLIFSVLIPRAAVVSSCTMWTFVSLQQICERLLLHGQHLWQCFQVADGDRAELRGEFPLLETHSTAGASVHTGVWLELVRKSGHFGQRMQILFFPILLKWSHFEFPSNKGNC